MRCFVVVNSCCRRSVMIVVTLCGAAVCVQPAAGEENLAPSPEAGPEPVWVVVVASTQGRGFGLAYKVTDFV
jgi:hypothetical protein